MHMKASEVQVDFVRKDRIGIAEAVFCLQKNVKQIEEILEESKKNGGSILLTRLSEEKYLTLRPETRGEMDYDPLSETGFHCLDASQKNQEPAKCVIIAAGTSDARVAREAMRTLEFNGIQAHIIFDVGVAGIWRLMARIEEIRNYPVVIAVAGMDGALPTVLGGLVPGVVIALPTSNGYGASRDGETALAACLSSCAPGIVVCNIDNGYGAACAALRILSATRTPLSSEPGKAVP